MALMAAPAFPVEARAILVWPWWIAWLATSRLARSLKDPDSSWLSIFSVTSTPVSFLMRPGFTSAVGPQGKVPGDAIG